MAANRTVQEKVREHRCPFENSAAFVRKRGGERHSLNMHSSTPRALTAVELCCASKLVASATLAYKVRNPSLRASMNALVSPKRVRRAATSQVKLED